MAKQVLALVTSSVERARLDIDDFYAELSKFGTTEEYSQTLAEAFWLLWIKLDGSSNADKRVNLIELMRSCVRDKKVERKVVMEVLDPECMHAAGLIGDIDTWRKKEIRYNTKALYTVNKYNLIREDSEGYAKLIVALNHFGQAALTDDMVPQLYREIQALIGYFDLDPNRVLDMVLDAAEAQPNNRAYLQLVPQFKRDAVVHLLGFKFQHHQASGVEPAWPNLPQLAASLISAGLISLDELLGHLAPSDEAIRKAQEAAVVKLKEEVDKIGVIILNAPKEPAAAGKEGEGGDNKGGSNTIPAPPERPTGFSDRDALGGRGMGPGGIIANIKAGGGPPGMGPAGFGGGMGGGMGGINAPYGVSGFGGGPGGPGGGDDRLATSGLAPKAVGLRADMLELDPAATYESLLLDKDVAHNQKLALAQALLQEGDWEHALELMNRLTALGVQPAAYPPLASTLCHIVAAELSPILQCITPDPLGPRPASDVALSSLRPLLDIAEAFLAKPNVQAEGSRGLLAALQEKGVPVGPPLTGRAIDAMQALGPFLSRNLKLLTKVIRAVRHHLLLYGLLPAQAEGADSGSMSVDTSDLEVEASKVEDLIARVLLPASCLVPSVPAIAYELWELLKHLPYARRYKLYADFKELQDKSAYLSAAYKLAVYETRKVLKRIHSAPDRKDLKEACKPHGRLLAKISAANPMAVLETLVAMVEQYSNQIDPVVEGLRYLTPLGYDTLTYIILTRLNMERSKVKDDGINISNWLQSLAKFTGAVCRKYPDMEIAALCQFLANALRGADSFDLLVLKELVETLTGISVPPDLSGEQLEGTLGGDTLGNLVMMRDTEKSKKAWQRGARRLLEALQRGPRRQHLALPLFLLVAQQRQIIMMQTQAQHIKFVVELYDKCHETCVQYIQFLQAALSPEDYAQLLPSWDDLRNVYKLDQEIAFMAYRPILRSLLDAAQAAAPRVEEGEIDAAGGGATGPDAQGEDPPETGATEAAAVPAVAPAATGLPTSWAQALATFDAYEPNKGMWQGLTPDIFALFWTLTIHDLYVPGKAYESELEKAKAELKSLEQRISSARMPGPGALVSDEVVMEWVRQRERFKDVVRRLPLEKEAQEKRVADTMAMLSREKERLLEPVSLKKQIALNLVQECILPRMLTSPQDAAFAAQFAYIMHTLNVPYFSTVWYYNELIKCVVPSLRSVTDREAVNAGVFLHETFCLLNHWRTSEVVYERECKQYIGFGLSLTQIDPNRTSYDQYQKLVHKWHNNAQQMFRTCLESKEYTSRRNAFTVLMRILDVFPLMDTTVTMLRQTLTKVVSEEEREDLKVLARSYQIKFEAEVEKQGRIISAELLSGKPTPKVPLRRPPGARPGGSASSTAPSTGAVKPGTATPQGGRPAASTTGPPASAQGKPGAEGASAPKTEAAEGPGAKPAAAPASRLRPDAPEFKSPPTAGAGTAGASTGGGAAVAATGSNAAARLLARSMAAATDGASGPDGDGRASKRVKIEPPPEQGTKGEGSAAPAPAAAGGGGSGGSSRPLKREAAGAPASQDAGAAQQPPAPASKRLRTDAPSAVDPAPAKVEPRGDREGSAGVHERPAEARGDRRHHESIPVPPSRKELHHQPGDEANADGRHDRASALQRGMSSGAAGPQPAGHLHAAGEKRDRGDAGSSREGRRPSRNPHDERGNGAAGQGSAQPTGMVGSKERDRDRDREVAGADAKARPSASRERGRDRERGGEGDVGGGSGVSRQPSSVTEPGAGGDGPGNARGEVPPSSSKKHKHKDKDKERDREKDKREEKERDRGGERDTRGSGGTDHGVVSTGGAQAAADGRSAARRQHHDMPAMSQGGDTGAGRKDRRR